MHFYAILLLLIVYLTDATQIWPLGVCADEEFKLKAEEHLICLHL